MVETNSFNGGSPERKEKLEKMNYLVVSCGDGWRRENCGDVEEVAIWAVPIFTDTLYISHKRSRNSRICDGILREYI